MIQHQLSHKLTEVVSVELERLITRDRELVTEIEQLQRERNELRKPIDALQSLMDDAQTNIGRELRDINAPHLASTDDPIEIAVAVLRERLSQDMHYKVLADEVMNRGGRLPKSEPWTHLNFLMNHDTRFVRPHRRGYYALKEDYPNLKRSVGERRRKRAINP